MSDLTSIISQLENQRNAIDKALSALKGLSEPTSPAPVKRRGRPKKATTASLTTTAPVAKKRVLSEAGRKRIAEAVKARWAAKKAAATKPAAKKTVRKSAKKATKKASVNQSAE